MEISTLNIAKQGATHTCTTTPRVDTGTLSKHRVPASRTYNGQVSVGSGSDLGVSAQKARFLMSLPQNRLLDLCDGHVDKNPNFIQSRNNMTKQGAKHTCSNIPRVDMTVSKHTVPASRDQIGQVLVKSG